MSKRFATSEARDAFLQEPRLAILMYQVSDLPLQVFQFGSTGTAVYCSIVAGASSDKIKHLRKNPNASVLVTNHVGEPEGLGGLL